jgi:hypothetical protein
MKFFIDTADVAEIADLAGSGLVDGVTTNPSLVAKSGRNFFEIVREICEIVPGPVSAEVAAVHRDRMLAEGRKLARLAPNVCVKLPLTRDGLKACRALTDEGTRRISQGLGSHRAANPLSRATTLRAMVMAASCMFAANVAVADEPLSTMLAKLAPAKHPEGSVEVVSWVERNGSAPELVVTLVPKGQVKLVADPGVTVTPVARDGIAWSDASPISRVDPDQGYFAEPPTLRVPFAREDGRPVEATVEFAYCLVDYQCLFGEARTSAPTQAPQG